MPVNPQRDFPPSRPSHRWLAALLAMALPALWVPAVHAQPADDQELEPLLSSLDKMERKRPGLIFGHPARDTPAEQLAYARRLAAHGHERRARRQLNALVRTWHDTPEAAQAQRELADLLVAARKYEDAFEAYQYLIRYFPGTFPYQSVLENQFNLAEQVRVKRRGKLFVLRGYRDPSRAIPLFEQVVENGPNWERAAEAQYLQGKIQQEGGNFELAVISFETLQIRYPNSPFAADAAFRRALCLATLSRQSRHDEDQLREALHAMHAYRKMYPTDTHAKEADGIIATLRQRVENMYFERAAYYDRIAKNPKAAIIAYNDFIKTCPNSERRAVADERIATLQLQLEKTNEN